MNLLENSSSFGKFMAYAIVCTLIVAFGAIGSVLAGNFGEQYSLLGLFLGSSLGAFIAVYESTVIGCIVGMLIGALISPVLYHFIDFETAYLAVFISSFAAALFSEYNFTFPSSKPASLSKFILSIYSMSESFLFRKRLAARAVLIRRF